MSIQTGKAISVHSRVSVDRRISPARRGTAADSLRAVHLLWRRELVKLRRNPLRIALGLIAPLMFLLVLGTGLESATGASGAGLRAYRTYLFPGVLLMAAQAPAIAVGVSIVLDRRSG